MDKITLINVGTEEEANALYNDFMQSTKQNNRECKLWMLATVTAGIILFLLVEWLMSAGIIRNIVQIAIAGAAYIVLNGCFAAMEPTTSYFYPPAYKYHNIIKKYNIMDMVLHSRYGKYDLELVVEDEEHRVSYEFLFGFDAETRTDVQNHTVDIKNRKVYEPYQLQETKIYTSAL